MRRERRPADPDDDLAALPDSLRTTAHVFDNGEVDWRNEHAEAAINALAAAGHKLLGLDARTLFPDGGVMEVPISEGAFHADAVGGSAVSMRPGIVVELPLGQTLALENASPERPLRYLIVKAKG